MFKKEFENITEQETTRLLHELGLAKNIKCKRAAGHKIEDLTTIYFEAFDGKPLGEFEITGRESLSAQIRQGLQRLINAEN